MPRKPAVITPAPEPDPGPPIPADVTEPVLEPVAEATPAPEPVLSERDRMALPAIEDDRRR